MSILPYILLLLYPCISGFKDAVLWSGRSYGAVKWDLHYLFTAERIVFGASIIAGVYGEKWDVIVALGCTVLAFPFFHNGFYYLGRKKIDGAYNSWFESPEGKWNLSWGTRSIMFGLSLILIICYGLLY